MRDVVMQLRSETVGQEWEVEVVLRLSPVDHVHEFDIAWQGLPHACSYLLI
jgi:hypothetical protein